MLNTKYYLVKNEKGQYGVMRVRELFGIFRYVSFLSFRQRAWVGKQYSHLYECWEKEKQNALDTFDIVHNGYKLIEELS